MNVKEVKKILGPLFKGIKGTLISCNERNRRDISSNVYVYGEAELDSMVKIFDVVSPKKGEVFYDMGSGVGKQVISAALLFDFSAVKGIDIMQDLYKTSIDVLSRFNEEFAPKLPPSKVLPEIEFILGDFLKYDISDADVIFSCSTCFDDEMMESIAEKVEKLKTGSRVITLTKSLPSNEFEEIHHCFYPMSWGTSQVFIYKKLEKGSSAG